MTHAQGNGSRSLVLSPAATATEPLPIRAEPTEEDIVLAVVATDGAAGELAKRTQGGWVKAARKMKERYLPDPGRTVFGDSCCAWRAEQDESQRELLAYLLFGARDGFFRTSACRWLAPLLHQPGTPLTPGDFGLSMPDPVGHHHHRGLRRWLPRGCGGSAREGSGADGEGDGGERDHDHPGADPNRSRSSGSSFNISPQESPG